MKKNKGKNRFLSVGSGVSQRRNQRFLYENPLKSHRVSHDISMPHRNRGISLKKPLAIIDKLLKKYLKFPFKFPLFFLEKTIELQRKSLLRIS